VKDSPSAGWAILSKSPINGEIKQTIITPAVTPKLMPKSKSPISGEIKQTRCNPHLSHRHGHRVKIPYQRGNKTNNSEDVG